MGRNRMGRHRMGRHRMVGSATQPDDHGQAAARGVPRRERSAHRLGQAARKGQAQATAMTPACRARRFSDSSAVAAALPGLRR